MEKFEEWFNDIVKKPKYLGTNLQKEAWYYQQEKIEKLQSDLDRAVLLLSDVIGDIYTAHNMFNKVVNPDWKSVNETEKFLKELKNNEG